MRTIMPVDTGEPALYVHIVKPKSGRCGAREQYSSIEDALEYRYLERILQNLGVDDSISPFIPTDVSRRLGKVLESLALESRQFTLGGLRGGGAVAHYRRHKDIATLMWQMRLTNQATLYHYLQEANTSASLHDMSPQSRTAIQAAGGGL